MSATISIKDKEKIGMN
jgi:hypothetical protein